MRKISFVLLMLVCCINYSFGQNSLSGPIVKTPVYFDISPPLRDMVKNLPPKAETSWKDGIVKNKFNVKPKPQGQMPGWLTDPNLQTTDGMLVTDTTIMNFDGNTNTQGYYPPDTHGDVGPTHYFQVVNCHYSIYNKSTGALMLGPLNNSSIFSGLPNNQNDGDAVVLYDEQAGRWLFSQFSLPNFPNGPFYQMIAVSQTGDPTGSWYRYQYAFTDMNDYPKFGVWGDGYYMSMHIFASGSTNYAGIGAVAFNRTLMLAGNPAATMVMFTKSSSDEAFGWLPSDCDGTFPSGNPPNYFLYSYDGASNDHLGVYEFHVDWTNTANSTFTNFLSLPVNAFTANITSITQKGSTVKLDALSDRMMYRLQYRTFGSYSTLVCNHTVDVSSTIAGIRWYELRKTTGAWSIYQQGTYSLADNNNRWMGSIAMDASGNIALGYSVSGSNLYPSIRYTGRKNNDALNTMTIAERGIFNGAGAQTGVDARWGDYSAMSCDPTTTTFWYTTEYLATTSSTGWRTRIASFRFASTPIVATLAATPVTGTGGTLNGTVNPNGLATTYHFEWGTTTSYGTNTSTISAGSGTAAVAVSAILTGLTGGIPIHFRLVAVNSDGTSNGSDLTFVPGGAAVTTTAASSIAMTTATSGGNVTSDGGASVTARGVCWGTSANPVVSGSHTTDGAGTGTYTSSITGLVSNTLYHVRAYATNANGTFYGNDLTFTTQCGVYTLPFTEGYTNLTIPNCWTQVDNQGNGQVWQFGAISGYNPLPALTGNYAFLNSDAYGSGNSQNADLVTPTLNLSGYSAVNLAFNHFFRDYSGSSGYVAYSVNNGATWTTITTFTTTSANNPEAYSQAVNAVAGQSQVKFKWNYTGSYDYYWGIDNINITGTCITVPVSVSIAASSNPVCAGTNVTYTATPTNGGTTPAYQWKVNGSNVTGATNATYSFTPANNNTVLCVLTSNAFCTSGNPATSNTVAMTVNPVLPVSISIVASANPVDAGTPVTFTATAINGGAAPVYQWKMNGSTVGTNSTSYTYVPANGNVVFCIVTAAETCRTSNPANSNSITMVVNAVPTTVQLQNITVSGNQCFNATQTISVAGNGNFFTVQNGGHATMIAGQNILYYPGTVVAPGGYMYGYIAPGGPWCIAPPIGAVMTGQENTLWQSEQPLYKIYPNPTSGIFSLEPTGLDQSAKIRVEIYGIRGDKVLSAELSGKRIYEFSLKDRPAGIYLIHILAGKQYTTGRIVKQD